MPQYTVHTEIRWPNEFAIIADTPEEAGRKAEQFARLIARDPEARPREVEVVIHSTEPTG
ncbi:hypothetical protein ACFC58_06310 [Kitasatospora purpeofusca]|uniref:hypothetical protein n=1 Tax=Kitasatospora purpeofusca TaxID=67352 RepID=UPI0035D6D55A